MYVSPYLFFNGECEEAFRFYHQCLGGTIGDMHTLAESPQGEDIPAELQGRIMHASLQLGEGVLMGSDALPGHEAPLSGFSVALGFTDAKEAERVFNALAEGGSVTEPLAATDWALVYGALRDRFGISWMVNCDRESPS